MTSTEKDIVYQKGDLFLDRHTLKLYVFGGQVWLDISPGKEALESHQNNDSL